MRHKRPRRTVRLDLTRLFLGAAAIEEPDERDAQIAEEAARMVTDIVNLDIGLPMWSTRALARIPDEVWDAAHQLANGGMNSPHLRAAAEQIDSDAFPRLMGTLTRLDSRPDPSIAKEFI